MGAPNGQGRPKVSEGRLWVEYQRRVAQIVIWQGAEGPLLAARGGPRSSVFGPHADQPCRFTTIEQKVSGLRMHVVYDEQLKNLDINHPFRNAAGCDEQLGEYDGQVCGAQTQHDPGVAVTRYAGCGRSRKC